MILRGIKIHKTEINSLNIEDKFKNFLSIQQTLVYVSFIIIIPSMQKMFSPKKSECHFTLETPNM